MGLREKADTALIGMYDYSLMARRCTCRLIGTISYDNVVFYAWMVSYSDH